MPTENRITSALLWTGLVLGCVAAAALIVVLPPKVPLALTGALALSMSGGWLVRRYAGSFALAPAVAAIGGVALISANGVRLSTNVTYSDALFAVAAFALLIVCLRVPSLVPPIPDWLSIGAGLVLASVFVVELLPPAFAGQSAQVSELVAGVSGSTNLLMGARVVVALAIVPVIIAGVCTSYSRFRIVVNAWVVGIAASCLVALLAAFTPFNFQALLTGDQYTLGVFSGGDLARFTGLTVHPNHLGLAAVLALPVPLSRLDRHWSNLALAAALASGALVSGSRAALGAVLLAVIVVFVLQPRARRPLAILAGVAAVVGFLYASRFQGLTSVQRLTEGGATLSNTERAQALSDSLSLFYARPVLGFGFETVRLAHNVPLQMLVAGGFLAFAGYATVIGGALVTARRLARSKSLPRDLRVTAAALAASLIVWIGASLLQNNTIDRFVYAPVALVLGLWVAHRREMRRSALA